MTKQTKSEGEQDNAVSVLRRIVRRFEMEDDVKGDESFDDRRSPLAWAMYTDAKEFLDKGKFNAK